MDHGTIMFLAGLLSGAGIGWYSGLMKERAAYGDPKERLREIMYLKGLLLKAGVSVDSDKVE